MSAEYAWKNAAAVTVDELSDLRRRLDEAEHEAMALRVERDELREAVDRWALAGVAEVRKLCRADDRIATLETALGAMLREGGAWTASMQAIYDEAMGA